MVLGCNHELHGTSGDCASLAGTKAIAGAFDAARAVDGINIFVNR